MDEMSDDDIDAVVADHEARRMHPVTGLPFNYDSCCNQCVHFCDRTRTVRKVKYRITRCALDPEQRNLADIPGTVWKAMPGCTEYQRD